MSLKTPRKRTHPKPKTGLRLSDLDQAKSAVLKSLGSADAQRGYRHAIDEFVEWYCSEPRLSFSRTVVLRYRIHVEERHLAPGTINLRSGAVRRLAYEAADCGLLSPDLAAGIRRAKGARRLQFLGCDSKGLAGNYRLSGSWAVSSIQRRPGNIIVQTRWLVFCLWSGC